jgi:hypothetical protein
VLSVRTAGLIVTSCLLAACPGPSGVDPDAPGDDDGPQPGNGVTIAIRSEVAIPQGEGDIRITSVELHTSTIRAIGDATTGNDELTTKSNFELRWDQEHTPEPFTFAKAPTGRYSRIEIRVAQGDGNKASLAMAGQARVDGDLETFEIELHDGVVTASVEITETLAAGAMITVSLEADLESLVSGIDFGEVPLQEGTHRIDDARVEAAGIRSRLAEAFDRTDDDGDESH